MEIAIIILLGIAIFSIFMSIKYQIKTLKNYKKLSDENEKIKMIAEEIKGGVMDASETYMQMCEKAEEIQNIRKGFSSGALGEIWFKNGGFQIHNGRRYVGIEAIWLPRQDQLQEILAGKHCIHDMILYFLDFVSENAGCCNNEHGYDGQFDTLEQLWLAFVMQEKYQKQWDSDKWVNNE